MPRNRRAGVGLAGGLVAQAFMGQAASAIDWDTVEGRDIVLFYPGQSSWEWSLTKSDHSGGPKIRKGKTCQACHEGEEADIAKDPVEGRRATLPLNVKVAHDGERLYARMEWPAVERPGGRRMDTEYEAKLTLMLADSGIKEVRIAGCWAACHDDLTGMASAPEGTELSKYLAASRTRIRRSGGGENFKADSDLKKLLEAGTFLEYWQARLDRGRSATAADAYVLERWHEAKTPIVNAQASLTDGRWSVVLSRPLVSSSTNRKGIVPGEIYVVGFAIHEDHAAKRFHHVSLEYTLALDKGDADFVAVER